MLAEGPPSALLSEPCRARSSRFLHASSRHHEQQAKCLYNRLMCCNQASCWTRWDTRNAF